MNLPAAPQPVLPEYGGACVANIVPGLLAGEAPGWLPEPALVAQRHVLLVLDGLGWMQLQERLSAAPTLAAMVGGKITTVAPSTTATGLTSIATGVPAGEHGVVGYRIWERGEILNCLRWTVAGKDVRQRIDPTRLQPVTPFLGARPVVVTKSEFNRTGFTLAHLRTGVARGWRVVSTMALEIRNALEAGEPFVYAYYDGIDKISHEYGLADHYDAELGFVDRLVAEVLSVLPDDVALLVTADHGQIHVGDGVVQLPNELAQMCHGQSGEGRFRWLHTRRPNDVLALAAQHFGSQAWVVSQAQACDEGWFGPVVTDAARSRLGDVALVPFAPISFEDPADTGEFKMIGRHGSLTPEEMYVPLLAGTRR
jgi:hypothetical protein